jgi:hypothetical protein
MSDRRAKIETALEVFHRMARPLELEEVLEMVLDGASSTSVLS